MSRIGKRDDEDCDLPGDEFWLGGEIVRNLDDETKTKLKSYGVHLDANPEKLFDALADEFLGGDENVSAT